MHTIERALLLWCGLIFGGASSVAGQQLAGGGGACLSSWAEERGADEFYALRMQEILSDSLYAAGRTQYSLVTLPPTEPSTVWVTSNNSCRSLLLDAVEEMNAAYKTTRRWQDTDFVAIDIGPYIAFVDLTTLGEFRSVVIFNAADGAFVTIINMM